MPKKITVTLLASILICGCSTSASISRIDGRDIQGKIQRSTSDAVVVATRGGTEVSVPRSEITDIDHPGNAIAVLGGLVGAYGALNIAVGAPTCSDTSAAYCVGVALPAAAGAAMLIWGLSTWLGSTDAAGSDSSAGTVPEVPPASAFDFSPAAHGGKTAALRVR
jgi:hypothetical protein